MEISTILYVVVILFIFATMMGISMLVRQMGGESVTSTFMYAHSAVAGVSYLILLYYSYQNPDDYPKPSIILFALAGILGAVMFINFKREKSNPIIMEVLYGLLALSGFAYLFWFAFLRG
jgi:hypothetical protein